RLGGPLPHQQANPPRARPRPEAEATLFRPARGPDGASGINPSFPGLSRCRGLITHVLLTRSPLSPGPKPWFSLDLHVLSAPPAFVLSQDQTLREEVRPRRDDLCHFELVLKDVSTVPNRCTGKAGTPPNGVASDASDGDGFLGLTSASRHEV